MTSFIIVYYIQDSTNMAKKVNYSKYLLSEFEK